VLKGVLGHCREHYPGLFVPVLTTNGTLLTPPTVELLVEHDVSVAVSLDGPEQEHDRMRVDARGGGSFARVMANLRRIKSRYPDFWLARMTSLSVYDWGTDLETVERFFEEQGDALPRSLFVNPVSPRHTGWYGRYQGNDQAHMDAALGRLGDRYRQARIDGESSSSYLRTLIGLGLSFVSFRARPGDARPAFLPFSGTCVPGDKIAVNVDGKLDVCERVNGSYPIGHLDMGIDYERVTRIIAQYQEEILPSCPSCPATRLCGLCYSFLDTQGGITMDAGQCAATVASARRRLVEYVSVLEENPHADLLLQTDTVTPEERLLFLG
jgi:uncharacterized protein